MPRSLSVLKAGWKLKPNVSEDISSHKNKTITKRHHQQQQKNTTSCRAEQMSNLCGEKKRAWKNSWEILHQYSASAFQFMWKLGLKIFVFWLALLHVVSALAFVNTNLKHTFQFHVELRNYMRVSAFITNSMFSLFLIFQWHFLLPLLRTFEDSRWLLSRKEKKVTKKKTMQELFRWEIFPWPVLLGVCLTVCWAHRELLFAQENAEYA